jgi:hypothetical protein
VGLGGVAAECSFVFFFEEGVGEKLLSLSRTLCFCENEGGSRMGLESAFYGS